MENLLFLGVQILKHIRVIATILEQKLSIQWAKKVKYGNNKNINIKDKRFSDGMK